MSENKYTTIFTNENEKLSHDFNLPENMIYLGQYNQYLKHVEYKANSPVYFYILSTEDLLSYSNGGELSDHIHFIKKTEKDNDNFTYKPIKPNYHILFSLGNIPRLQITNVENKIDSNTIYDDSMKWKIYITVALGN